LPGLVNGPHYAALRVLPSHRGSSSTRRHSDCGLLRRRQQAVWFGGCRHRQAAVTGTVRGARVHRGRTNLTAGPPSNAVATGAAGACHSASHGEPRLVATSLRESGLFHVKRIPGWAGGIPGGRGRRPAPVARRPDGQLSQLRGGRTEPRADFSWLRRAPLPPFGPFAAVHRPIPARRRRFARGRAERAHMASNPGRAPLPSHARHSQFRSTAVPRETPSQQAGCGQSGARQRPSCNAWRQR
jgi:hypothetical protein